MNVFEEKPVVGDYIDYIILKTQYLFFFPNCFKPGTGDIDDGLSKIGII